jgi:hypothetical protein
MFSIVLTVLALATVISARCYDISGSLVTSDDTLPCNSISGTISMCCATNRGPSDSFTADTCLPNGLCQNIFTNLTTGKPDTNYWREGCSDSEWDHQYCLKGICDSSLVGIISYYCQDRGFRTDYRTI